ncbi:MAG: hypothetical protein KDE31_07130, partial [Caldilineaceae bacterium]|nr:hypothetical protein [Caldilineaceae bacterium]
ARLSILRGGFTRQAAQRITGASLRGLGKLTSKSHLQYDRDRDRYQIHELLRQYGAEKLAKNVEVEAAVCDRHSAYYTDLLHLREALLKGPKQLTALAEIEADFENVRSAWDWAMQQQQTGWIERGLESLSRFYEWYGRYQEGAATFRRGAELLATIDQPLLLARILIKQATFDRVLGNIATAESLLQQSQRLIAEPVLVQQETRHEQAAIWQGLAGLATHASQSQTARDHYDRSLALYQEVGDRWAVARVLLEMSYLTRNFSRFPHAQDYRNQLEATKRLVLDSTAIFREFGDRAGVAGGLFQLGGTFLFLGQFAEAQTVLKESVAIHKELGLKSGLILATAHLANTNALLGLHEQAVVEGQFALDLAREIAYPAGIHMGLGTAIWAAMRRGDYHEAQRFAQENIALNQMRGEQRELAYSLAFLGIACRDLGNTVQARQQLVKALEISIGTRAVGPLFFCLALANYLLVDAGKYVQAAELDALRATYPVSGSRMMHLPPIFPALAPLPANIRAAAQARGRKFDLWATAQVLLAEFSTDDNVGHPLPTEALPLPRSLPARQQFAVAHNLSPQPTPFIG